MVHFLSIYGLFLVHFLSIFGPFSSAHSSVFQVLFYAKIYADIQNRRRNTQFRRKEAAERLAQNSTKVAIEENVELQVLKTSETYAARNGDGKGKKNIKDDARGE